MTNKNAMQQEDVKLWRVIDIALKFAVPLMFACLGFVAKSLIDHETRISVIENNRFTPADAQQLETRLKHEMPPPWFKEKVDEMSKDIKAMREAIAELRAKQK